MKIQSLSVVVPNRKCVNNCKFCVSRMREENYEDMLAPGNIYRDLYKKDFQSRLMYAREAGCDSLMLTGNSEPQQNRRFLEFFADMNNSIEKPFRRIDMQTTGVLLDDGYLYQLRHDIGVNTISVSTNSFDSDMNKEYGQLVEKVDIVKLCQRIKQYRFNLRLSLNLTDEFDIYLGDIPKLFDTIKSLGADQVTFRVLYQNGDGNEQDKWIENHAASVELIDEINFYIRMNGKLLYHTDFGQAIYSVDGVSTMLDDDCMSKNNKQDIKYLILRENCKLYSQWDDKGSLIF